MIEHENEPTEETGGNAAGDLKQLCETAFQGDIGAAALALGREEDQLADMMAGNTPVDEDLEMKVNGIAQQRGAGQA